jgi:hypothetical protein
MYTPGLRGAGQRSAMCPAAFAASSEEKPRPSLHLLGLRARAVVAGSPIARFILVAHHARRDPEA